MKKSKRELRDNICIIISVLLILGGITGLKYDDWTFWALVIPFGWAIVGCGVSWIINGKNANEEMSLINALLGVLVILNTAAILVHRDTLFIIGRISCAIGCTILCVWGAGYKAKIHEKEIEKLKQEIRHLKGYSDD